MVSKSTRDGLAMLALTDVRLRLALAAGAFTGLAALALLATLDYRGRAAVAFIALSGAAGALAVWRVIPGPGD
ncbi:hypothetical protein GCM10009037_14510 [Halarchaeum grantii]|uniref:Uncharacterized protein n=1 Tax=Halarchaeum grantii TaxID=1193105 RepID=A0A830F986_9EURY|nr:hypothetical protein [Halarchaeum grantii]GGL31980.1 hypothetical protein GCM10009037_14510 [Halarchaeum grantii]